MLNEYLIEAFRKLGKSQGQIIKDLGKSQPYVSALMNGKKVVGKEIAKQLHLLYGFDEGEILKGGKISEDSDSYVEVRGMKIPTDEMVLICLDNEHKLLKHKAYSNNDDLKVAKKLASLSADKEALKKFLGMD